MPVMSRPRVIGQYEIHAELGRGGSGIVWLGRAREGGACVAVKSLLGPSVEEPGLQNALREEARLSSLVVHANVISTVDVVSTGTEVFLVMPYVHGVTLAALLRICIERGVTVPVEIAARLVHDLLLGLDATHRARDLRGRPLHLVHRDVSPQNLIVASEGVSRLIDFGIAKGRDSANQTALGELKGKAPYIAPEVLEGADATPLTDVYAAAVVLWEALCARRLFRGTSATDIWEGVLRARVQAPSAVVGRPVSLDQVVLRGLSRAPEARPRSAKQMADDIARASRLAPRERVAAWVSWCAGPELERRAAMVRAASILPSRRLTESQVVHRGREPAHARVA